MTQHAERTHHFTFNTDGRPHPLENGLVAVTFALGVIAVATCGFRSLHSLAAWTGVAGLITGGWGQFISVTTAERFALIIGLGLAGLGFYIGMAHGGFV
ncbi:hypothetical protein [Actinacidiphila acididurans]|uniref:Integral membrane protein n=1 Tax=Actinacidiphila acididurans TaxID=2784346 RepID=A0ABS2TRK6_9ACTN|nr:hypothetical protein [Actinacidiphila acididurans]MBM9505971.1 hypothetical protein [Actinacidiphila acididurans]